MRTTTSKRELAAFDELLFELSSHTLASIGARLGLSKEYVRQIEERALWKLERAARRAGLKEHWETLGSALAGRESKL